MRHLIPFLEQGLADDQLDHTHQAASICSTEELLEFDTNLVRLYSIPKRAKLESWKKMTDFFRDHKVLYMKAFVSNKFNRRVRGQCSLNSQITDMTEHGLSEGKDPSELVVISPNKTDCLPRNDNIENKHIPSVSIVILAMRQVCHRLSTIMALFIIIRERSVWRLRLSSPAEPEIMLSRRVRNWKERRRSHFSH